MPENFSEPKFEGESQPEERGEEIAHVREMLNELYNRKDGLAFYEAMVDKAVQLKSKYHDFNKYRLYHLLISSTPAEGQTFSEFDFPGEDSIIKFLEDKVSN